MSTTSTSPSTTSSASATELACAATSMPSSVDSNATMPSRNTGWSSTTATRMDEVVELFVSALMMRSTVTGR
ncbi:hypothetical protein [Rhodococcus koreensis]